MTATPAQNRQQTQRKTRVSKNSVHPSVYPDGLTTVVTYRFAYVPGEISLCPAHDDDLSAGGTRGPVHHGQHAGICDVCARQAADAQMPPPDQRADIIVDALVPAIAPAQLTRARRLAATWAAALPSDVVWHEALHEANGYEGVTDQMTTILSGNEGASDFDWDCDAYNNALQLTGWLLAEAFHATATTAQAVRS